MASTKKCSENSTLLEEPEVFLAVIIADSYDKSFQPCTLDKSRVLVPLANRPLIDYTLAFLSLAGVEEVIIYCTSFPHQIKSYVESSEWARCMTLKVIINEDAQSIGDALRDLDDKQMISTDFVLLNGDLIANINLKACLEAHKKTREKDKEAILTKVMKKCPPGHRLRSADTMDLYAINKSTNQILSHMKVEGTSKVKLPTELIRENKELQLRYDLLDCQVTICAAMVPSLLTDNFDYQTVSHLVQGVLGNQEILSATMHVNILEEGYAARVCDFYSYKTVSGEVMDKWAYPFCPDRTWGSATHLHKGCNFSRTCELAKSVITGSNTSIGDSTVVKNSVIGDNCSIGANVEIKDSIIWKGVRVEDGCKVYNSIVCDDVILYKGTQLCASKSGVKITPQIILGGQVKLGPEAMLDEEIMLVSQAPASEWGDEVIPAHKGAGSKGVAYPFTPLADDLSEEGSEGSGAAEMTDDELLTSDTDLFYSELLDAFQRASAEKISAENIILDINSLKHAYNIQINEVNHMIMQAVLDRPNATSMTSQQLLSVLNPLLKVCLHVFKNYYRSEKSQLECLQAMQEFVGGDSRSMYLPIMSQVIMFFYQNDILEEEVIISWYENLPAVGLKTQVTKLVKWFEEADSESESD
ncbi:translation initiation factor eIF2B subunit epsilon-like [Watersipora subatra]|uniref:translation initiation factor eIF2B subunit epsilon-like n=1 Tax=Watersipora subatra TaxID=2589382 RepID=UPI00355B538E